MIKWEMYSRQKEMKNVYKFLSENLHKFGILDWIGGQF
jgi:hypothetical protein